MQMDFVISRGLEIVFYTIHHQLKIVQRTHQQQHKLVWTGGTFGTTARKGRRRVL